MVTSATYALLLLTCNMKVVLQRVKSGCISVDDHQVAKIGHGIVILIGIGHGDGEGEARYLTEKVANLRIFEDEDGKMNRSLLDVRGSALVVSQFTLFADTRKGRRPSFINAAHPDVARPLVEYFASFLADLGVPTQTGEFGSHMLVEINNDGPVTIVLER